MLTKQTCDRCSREMRFAFSIKDEIWNKLSGEKRNNVLCFECFLEQLENDAPKQKICLTDFYYLGVVGSLDNSDFGGTFIDSDYGKNRRILLE